MERDWERTGYQDGYHGNSKFPPPDKESRDAYMRGYLRGRDAFKDDRHDGLA